MSARRLTRLLWATAVLVLVSLLLKFFVADVYRVDSGSMRPTLFGGRDRADGTEDTEHVLVLYGRDLEPERFDLVVVAAPDGGKPLVKRVAGLPGDQDLMIRGGDLFVGRKRLPPDAPHPAPVPVYDDRWFEPERFFEFRRDGSVAREGEAWVVDGPEQAPGSLLFFHPKLRDDYLDRRHRRVIGVVEVNDAVLELEFLLEAAPRGQVLRFQLVEEGDTFEAQLVSRAEGSEVRLVRRNAGLLQEGRGEQLLAEHPLALEAGRWIDLAFSNIDNHLRVRSRGLDLDLGHTYAENEPWPAPLPPGQKSLGPRVRFGVQGGRARFRAVRILRDLYYSDDGLFAAVPHPGESGLRREPAPLSLGPDDYFLLGDNSTASTDSRHFGPVKATALLGRPLAVVWPDPRWLHPVEGP